MVSVGAVILGAFRLFREQRIAVLIWTMVAIAISAIFTLWYLPGWRDRYLAGSATSASMLGWIIPFYIFGLVAMLFQTSAAFRAVMRPDEGAAGFLRLGMDELRLLGLGLLWLILNLVFYLLLAVAAGAAIGAMFGVMGRPEPAVYLLLPVVLLPIYGSMIYLHVRLSPAIALTLLRRQIVIGEAWRLTRGQFWRLLAAYLAVCVMQLAGYALVWSVSMGPYLGELARGGSFATVAIARAQMGFGPLMAISVLLGAAFNVCVYATWAGTVGTATLELLGKHGTDYAATFE